MTDHDPLDRDELVAAYLDGEATPAERAAVEADATLMARAVVLRQVADMVAEPVMSPPPDVKRAHIAAALAASPTAANVTALVTRRKRLDMTKLAAVAAVVIAILAVPIVLLSNGDDDGDTVASGAASTDDDSAVQATESVAGDVASGDDGGDDIDEQLLAPEIRDGGESAELEAAPAPEPEAEPLEESSADEPSADAASDDGAAEAAGEDDLTLDGPAFGRAMGELESVGELAERLLNDPIGDDGGDGSSEPDTMPIEELVCVFPYLELGGGGTGTLTAFGTATIAGAGRTFAQLEEPDGLRLVVFDVATCNIVFDDLVE